MYYKKYESERIYLSPMSADDYQTYTKWINDETLSSGLGNFKSNITELSEKEWIENTCRKGEYNFSIIRKEDNMLLGTYGLEEEDKVSRRFHVGGFIGEIEERGKGYGTEALKLITKFAFEILNAETLFSGIYSFNEASVKSAKKAGYSIAGRYRNAYFYNGQFHDKICVEITKEDYLKSKVSLNEN
jgi:RimJ/RimL family protein N-acetyltransferase